MRVDDTTFESANAMDTKRTRGWDGERDGCEDGEDDRRYDAMTSSANLRKHSLVEEEVDGLDADSLDQQPSLSPPQKQRFHKRVRRWQMGTLNTIGYLFLLFAGLFILPASAVELEFENCLSNDVQNNEENGGLQLQFVPLFFDAVFNTTDPAHTLALRVWGNVTGSGPVIRQSPLPSPNSTYWESNSTESGGKIIDVPFPEGNNVHTTLASSIDVLTYNNAENFTPFCEELTNASCPLAPRFFGNK